MPSLGSGSQSARGNFSLTLGCNDKFTDNNLPRRYPSPASSPTFRMKASKTTELPKLASQYVAKGVKKQSIKHLSENQRRLFLSAFEEVQREEDEQKRQKLAK